MLYTDRMKFLFHVGVIAPDDRNLIAERLQALSRCPDRIRILIDADETSLFR